MHGTLVDLPDFTHGTVGIGIGIGIGVGVFDRLEPASQHR